MSDKKFQIGALLSVGFHEDKTHADPSIKLLEQKYNYLLMILEQEKERDKKVEHKASLFLASNAIVGSLLVWASRFLFEEWSVQTLIISFFLLVLVVLLAGTIVFTLKVLKKTKYIMLDQNDALNYSSEAQYYIEMAKKVKTVIESNIRVINQKVDNMAIAQRYYKFFWFFMVLFTAVVCIMLFLSNSVPELSIDSSLISLLLFACSFLGGYSIKEFIEGN